MKDKIFHLISNTHWDREWRFPFEKNRQMLVEMIDEVLYILEAEKDYRAFHLDSQSIVLHDYLAIRPEKKPLIEKFVRQKRLLIGPWFVLPEEFQVGGENLIRNLLLGHRICKEFGHVMKVGYSPFSWGQISQLPQIYRGFGIDVVMFYRGVNSLDSPKAEFIWEGADGTRMLTSRFSTMPRYNFYFYIYRPVIHNEQFADVEYPWKRGGMPFHFCDPALVHDDYYLLNPTDEYFKENIRPSVQAIIRDQADDFTTPHVFWAEGHDSSGPNRKTVRLLRDIRELMPEVHAVHSTLEEYAESIQKTADRSILPVVLGERRSAQYDRRSGNLYGYTTSARMYLKQKNFDAERWVQYYAEPMMNFASILGLKGEERYLDLAWYALLENSAHDSIGGCSLDPIHEDMMARYKKSIELAQGVFSHSVRFIAKNIALKNHSMDSIHILIINPTTYQRDEVVEAYIDVPAAIDKGTIWVTTNSGAYIYCQIQSRTEYESALEQLIDRPMYFKMIRYHCSFQTGSIPSTGFTTLHVTPVSRVRANRTRKILHYSKKMPVMENKFLRVGINQNGTLNILHKDTGTRYSRMGYFVDEGEAGHAWVHTPLPPVKDTLKSRAEISVLQNGHNTAAVKINHLLKVPATLDDRKGRHPHFVGIPIEVLVTLTRASKRIDVRIKLENTAESHRLRIMFPTGINAAYSYGEGQFDVVARPADRPDTSGWVEQPMYDYPMHHFVDVNNGVRGTAILVDGLKEYEFLNDKHRTLAITLLRGFRFIIHPSSLQDYSHQKGSQCPGLQEYRLAIYPYSGDWEQGQVYREALEFNIPLRLTEIGKTAGTLPPEVSFLSVTPEALVFSCFKKAEDAQTQSSIIRLYNPTKAPIKGNVKLFWMIESVSEVTLEEKPLQRMPVQEDGSFNVVIGSKQICTYLVMVKT